MVSSTERAPLSAWYALVVLTIVLLFATVDRAILSLLAEPVKNTLGLSDLQLGLMQGTGIAVFAALAAFPISWLADRYGRRLVLAVSVVIWSLAVVGCALAQNFTQMFFATAMVGGGEAGLAPITFALIADLFHRRQRQLANSVFVLASAAGGGLGMVLSGQLVTIVDVTRDVLPLALQDLESWRLAFLYAAMPAPIMIVLIATIRAIRSAQSSETDNGDPVEAANGIGLGEHLRRHKKVLIPFIAGMGCCLFAFAAVGAWMPVILTRLFEETPAEIGTALGSISLLAMAGGFLFSAFGIKLLESRMGDRLQIRTMSITASLCVCTSLAMIFAKSANQIYIIQAVQVLCLTAANMLFPTVLQNLAPSHLRARVIAIQVTVNTGAGAAAAPLVGLVSDQINDPFGVLWAAGSFACVGLFCASGLFLWCEKVGYVESIREINRDEFETPTNGTSAGETA